MRVRDREQMRRWRERRGLTQYDLAFLVGCTQSTISQLETGRMTTLSQDLALSIAKRLGFDWEDLFVACESVAVSRVTSGIQADRHSLSA